MRSTTRSPSTGTYTSAAPLDVDGRVITFFSFSKTYAMTGWRVGYLVVPPGVSPLIVRAQEPITSCVNAPAQMAALTAVTGPQECVAEMRDAYRHRRDLVTEFLSGRGIPHVRPRGAFYLMVDVSGSGSTGMDFVLRLLKEKQVAVVPGDTFGPGSGRFVRVSLATAPDLLMEGVERLAERGRGLGQLGLDRRVWLDTPAATRLLSKVTQ